MQQPELERVEQRPMGEAQPASGTCYCPECGPVGYASRHMHRRGSIVHMTPLGMAALSVVPTVLAFTAGFLAAGTCRRMR